MDGAGPARHAHHTRSATPKDGPAPHWAWRGEAWLAHTAAVVLAAWVENQPRRLLEAVAAGLPVIASAACGLAGLAGVVTLRENDDAALQSALADLVGASPCEASR